MNIVVVTREEFPYGSAATNRLLTYLPGIAALGHHITIICLFLSRKENFELLDEKGECEYKGLKIIYAFGKHLWPVGRYKYFSKAALLLKGRLITKRWLTVNRMHIDIIQMYSTSVSLFEQYGKICKRLNIIYTIERSELPDIIKKKDLFIRKRCYIKRSEKSFGLFDGWILETQTLVDYYSQFFCSRARYIVVPMTVDVGRFVSLNKTDTPLGQYIAYCGNMTEVDGVSILIKAYSMVKQRFPRIKLVLAGHSEDVRTQMKLVESLGLNDDVVFLGRLSKDEVPQFLVNATVLALASPTSFRACASMPCKVGEYLCTGNPVVVTQLGEINKYLVDGESAFLSRPDSADAFAEKLCQVLSDTDKAFTIGQKGKEVALRHFDSLVQVNRIESFYKELLNR